MDLNYTDVKLDLLEMLLKGRRESHRWCLVMALRCSSDTVTNPLLCFFLKLCLIKKRITRGEIIPLTPVSPIKGISN